MIQIDIKRSGWPAALMASPRKMMNEVTRGALLAQAREWQGKDLPKHFETTATARYGYQRRKRQYEMRKQRQAGHRRPLVFSGALERASKRANFRQQTNNVKVSFRGGQALNFSGKAGARGSTYPNMRRELTAITTDEIKQLSRTGRRYAERAFRDVNQRSRAKL